MCPSRNWPWRMFNSMMQEPCGEAENARVLSPVQAGGAVLTGRGSSRHKLTCMSRLSLMQFKNPADAWAAADGRQIDSALP